MEAVVLTCAASVCDVLWSLGLLLVPVGTSMDSGLLTSQPLAARELSAFQPPLRSAQVKLFSMSGPLWGSGEYMFKSEVFSFNLIVLD